MSSRGQAPPSRPSRRLVPQVIRPLDSQSESSDSFDPSPYIGDLFSCTIKRLKAADIDQEVKERAISCMGQIICNLGDRLPAELPGTLLIFLERLKNEITRLTTVKGKPRPLASPAVGRGADSGSRQL